jgi:hypothetical protein
MGTLSELGPIDPQINGLPALGIGSALRHLAALSTEYPAAADMIAKYLSQTLSLGVVGYFDRISVSAKDYAIKLLQLGGNSDQGSNEKIAHSLLNW